jgi:hypothetical protein
VVDNRIIPLLMPGLKKYSSHAVAFGLPLNEKDTGHKSDRAALATMQKASPASAHSQAAAVVWDVGSVSEITMLSLRQSTGQLGQMVIASAVTPVSA